MHLQLRARRPAGFFMIRFYWYPGCASGRDGILSFGKPVWILPQVICTIESLSNKFGIMIPMCWYSSGGTLISAR